MDFSERVYVAARRIPKGKVSTYGELAKAAGVPGASRAVGQAMRRNPYAPEVPCHRVVASDGSLHGFGGRFNNPEKARLLHEEGVEIAGGKVDLKKFGFRF
jgi:methylated-DNA-[protein]-cysteine S-methyltransferase